MSATNDAKLETLALAMATGSTSIQGWAEANGVSRRTAYRYAKLPGVRKRVNEIQTDMVDQALGRLSKHAASAVNCLARMQSQAGGAPESVRVAAAKAILGELNSMRLAKETTQRLAEVDKRLSQLESGPGGHS